MPRRALKVLHLLGAAGFTGALAAHGILLATASAASLDEYAIVRQNLAAISSWILVPSLAVALVSGMLGIAVHPPFHDAGWVWIKAAMGFPMFHATLLTVDSTAQRVSALSARAVATGDADPALLADLMAHEWTGLWTLLVLAVAQTVLGVWRPRRRRRRRRQRRSSPPRRGFSSAPDRARNKV